MALYDNKYWLLSHIRNSFISTDDTGMCELVMTGGDLTKHLADIDVYAESSDSDGEDDIEQESFDIQHDMDFSMHRQRSNTAVRLEKLEQAQRKAAKVKHIKWEVMKAPVNETELNDMFIKKEVKKESENVGQRSLFSEQLKLYTNLPQNPFINYAKFDGSAQVGVPVRKYKIFLTMLPEDRRNYPMTVTCLATAKIQDLIGLICLKCSTIHGDMPLQPVTHYGLYITEEDGEVDRDFPCLDPKEVVAKFGFTCLGLVEHKNFKTVSFDQSQESILTEPTETATGEPSSGTETFKLDDFKQISADRQMKVHTTAMEAPLYQSYKVFVINKVRAKIEIHLGISGDKFEIDPVQQKSSKFVLHRQKPVSYHMDSVAWCEISETRHNRSTFRVVYSLSFGANSSSTYSPSLQNSASFIHYDFESDNATAEEIVQKINLILELRSSTSRKEYLATRERKLYKRKSFNLTKP